MCGITGVISFRDDSITTANIKRMTDAIAHRGPDGEGQYVHENVGIGHRRLAIIDLSENASQPMRSQDESYVITYNGELYNYKEIKQELIKEGYVFKSNCDTEVILYSYIYWGCECVSKFNGMFAFAIYNNVKGTLFMARDRYGIKPLYYSFQNGNLFFGSEQKAILAYPEYKRSFDHEGLLEYFTFQNFFTDKTLEKDIKMFPQGHCCEISTKQETNMLPVTQYWDFEFNEPEYVISEGEYIEELDRLFKRAVRRQLMSDVDLGAYLSGGMDSGSITAVASKDIPYMKTFTCGFDMNSVSGLELGFDERTKAEYMSYLFKTEHYEMVLKAGDMERIVPKLAWHIEEPRVGQSYPNMYAAQLASKFCKVVLSGAGGDELFGGYPWRYYRAVVNYDFEDYIDKYYGFWQRLIPNTEIKKVFSPIWEKVGHVWTRDIFRDVMINRKSGIETPEDYINHSLYFEAKTFLHGLLTVEDKLSMAYGIETRVPFLDNDLVDFATKVPIKYKLRNLQDVIKINENETGNKTRKYFEKTNDGKLLLRTVMKNYIPDSVNSAAKQGFSAPDATWFRGESIEFVKKVIANERASIYEFMDYSEVQRLLTEHIEGKNNRRLLVWALISFEQYLRGNK